MRLNPGPFDCEQATLPLDQSPNYIFSVELHFNYFIKVSPFELIFLVPISPAFITLNYSR